MIALWAVALGVAQGGAQDTSRHVTWSAFVDTYYAYDFGRPASFDRVFTTQAARHDEFNINLAYVAGSLDQPAGARTSGTAGRHLGPVQLCE